jgi:hypothetical protein
MLDTGYKLHDTGCMMLDLPIVDFRFMILD